MSKILDTIKKNLEDVINKVKSYIEDIKYINPKAILIKRYLPPPTTKGGLHKTELYKDKEARSTNWGQVLKISSYKTDDLEVLEARKNIDVGDWVNFLAANPIQGGLECEKMVQLIAIQDVLMSVSDESFKKYIEE